MEQTFTQKIVMGVAVLCYLAAFGFLLASLFYESRSESDPLHASFMASVIFFVGCGIVLHVIARTRLKGLIKFDEEEENKRN